MPVLGISDEDFAELPDSVQTALKAQEAAQNANNATLTELQNKVEELTKGKPPKGEEPPPTNKWNPPVSPFEEMNYNNRCDIILMNFKNDTMQPVLGACVKLFENEIRESLSKSHPMYLADKVYIKNVIDMVAGRHTAEITSDIRGNGGKFASLFTESGSGGPNAPSDGKSKKPEDNMTPEEKKAADSWGISYEKWVSSREEGNK